MSNTANTTRVFQLISPILFEYEFNEHYNTSTTGEYGMYPIGDYEPAVMSMKNGTKVYFDTKKILPVNNLSSFSKENKLVTRNYDSNISIAYDDKNSMWYREKGSDPVFENYLKRNISFGVLNYIDDNVVARVFSGNVASDMENNTTEGYMTYEEIQDLLNKALAALNAKDAKLCESVIYDVFKRTKNLNCILSAIIKWKKQNNMEPNIFHYFVDMEDSDLSDVVITYEEAYTQIINDPYYYDYNISYDGSIPYYTSNYYEKEGKEKGYSIEKCIRLSERIVFTVCCELYAFRDNGQVVTYLTQDTEDDGKVYKYKSLDYTNIELRNLIVAESGRIISDNVSYIIDTSSMPFDKYRLYFLSGYYLNDCYAVRIRLSVKSVDGTKIILSDLFFSPETDINYIYMDNPRYVSNKIYDKYIEVRIPAVKYLTSYDSKIGGTPSELAMMSDVGINTEENINLAGYLDLDPNTNVDVEFSVIDKDNITEYTGEETDVFDVMSSMTKQQSDTISDEYLYQQSKTVTCVVAQTANSDRLTANITSPIGKNYIEFGGMWDNKYITWSNLSSFNRSIKMYNIPSKRNVDYYDANANNTVEWVGYHEVVAKFYGEGGSVVDGQKQEPLYTQRYNFQDVYSVNTNGEPIQYRPVVDRNIDIFGVVFEYTYTLMNILDDVQFVRKASVSITSDVGDGIANFFNDTMSLSFPVSLYNVFNKIERVENKIASSPVIPHSVKYTKVFYNTTDVVLDVSGEYYGDGKFVLPLSQAPKNYKFVFKKYDESGVLNIMDLSDASYKLYTRGSDKQDIIIEPTYSSNMNTMLGELEFNISINNIQKLKSVDTTSRFMSIIVVNKDNTQYSMFDFTYE